MTGPLQGVRIIDITSVLMGPHATQILGDLGADVVKIGTAGYTRLLNRDRRPDATRDGHLGVLVDNDKQWANFFTLIGRPEVMAPGSPDATIGQRTENIQALYAIVAEAMATRTSAEWTTAREAADIPVMPMHTLDSLLDDPHRQAVGFLRTVDHPSEGRIQSMAVPSTWSPSVPTVMRQAPRLGEHSAQILQEAGYSAVADHGAGHQRCDRAGQPAHQ